MVAIMKNKTLSLFGSLTISISLVLSTFAVVTSQIYHQQAMADASTSNNTATTVMSMTPVLGNPIFSEHYKITSQKQVIVNGSNGLSVASSGNGMIKGINFTDVGTGLVTFRPNGYGDFKGHGIITTTATGKDGDGGGSNGTSASEKAAYTIYATGRQDANGTVRDNGVAFFHTNSTTGKLASIDNLVVVFRDQGDKSGNGMTIGWEWK
jgi:hypothetical protein